MGDRPGTVGLLGGGGIGGGWAARFVLNGVDVRLYDPAPDADRAVGEVLANARRAMRRLTLAPLPPEGSLTLVDSPEAAVAGAAFVQESAPEREALKRDLLAAASRAAPADVVFASSTSGLLPSRLQADMAHPERLTVGHPFNPVYLLPLVEVCGGERTAPETVERAAAVYRALGMRPLLVRREIDGFLADRLLEALWREALWLVADDVATADEGDEAIRLRAGRRRGGLGRRWACMGPFLTYRIAGGTAGMRHFMEQFGPALKLPWTKLTDVPELTDELLDKVVAQSDAQADGLDVRALERAPADCLVSTAHGLRTRPPRVDRPGPAAARRRRRPGARRARARAVRRRAGRRGDHRRGRGAAPAPRRRRRARVDRLQRPRPREPLPAGLRRDDRCAAAPHRPRPRSGRQLLHGRDAPLAPWPSARGGAAAHDHAGPRPRRQAPARLPCAVPHRRRRAARYR